MSTAADNLSDRDLERYSRHLLLTDFSEQQQWRLSQATVLVAGAGGLGGAAALYLAASGIGHIVIADDDSVELSNLQRQIIHDQNTIGQKKVDSARRRLTAINSDIVIEALPLRADGHHLDELLQRVDLVIDATDNFASRYAINHACLKERRTLVYGAAIGWQGHVSVFGYEPGTACLECLFASDGQAAQENCRSSGVFAPLTGVVGSLQAGEAIKIIGGIGTSLAGRLQCIDLLQARWRCLTLTADPSCRACAANSGKLAGDGGKA